MRWVISIHLIRAGVLRLLEVDDEFRHELASMLREEQSSAGAELDSTVAAARLGFNRETVVRMAKGGRIPGAHKQGREWRFPAEGLTVLPAGGREITVTKARAALAKQAWHVRPVRCRGAAARSPRIGPTGAAIR